MGRAVRVDGEARGRVFPAGYCRWGGEDCWDGGVDCGEEVVSGFLFHSPFFAAVFCCCGWWLVVGGEKGKDANKWCRSIHNLGLVGHIEDIAVAKDQQGKKLGLRIIQALDYVAEKVGCYKVRSTQISHVSPSRY